MIEIYLSPDEQVREREKTEAEFAANSADMICQLRKEVAFWQRKFRFALSIAKNYGDHSDECESNHGKLCNCLYTERILTVE